MSRQLAISQRQAQTLFRAAEAEGGIVEVKIGETVFRLIPAVLAQKEKPVDEPANPGTFETLEQYRSWRERRRAGGD